MSGYGYYIRKYQKIIWGDSGEKWKFYFGLAKELLFMKNI